MNGTVLTTAAEILAALAKNRDASLDIDASVEISLSISAGSPTLRLFGKTVATVVAWGSSSPRVVARESSSPRVEARGSSSPRVVARESSSPTVEAWGSSSPTVVAWGSSSPRVVARESSSPTVVAWESSSPRVEARGSSSPRVVARESSSPTVEARGSSSPRVVARESSSPTVEAWGSSSPTVEAKAFAMLRLWGGGIKATASVNVSVLLHTGAKCKGGKQTKVVIKTPKDWCEYYGVEVVRGVATLYKALDDNFASPHGTFYTPGTNPIAPDWDKGKRECGGGLHFSPTPMMAKEFHESAKRFVACQVKLSDIAIHPDGEYPQKCKAKCCSKCVEVTVDGEVVA